MATLHLLRQGEIARAQPAPEAGRITHGQISHETKVLLCQPAPLRATSKGNKGQQCLRGQRVPRGEIPKAMRNSTRPKESAQYRPER